MNLTSKGLLQGPVQAVRIIFQALVGLDSSPAVTTVALLDRDDRREGP
jgi:hypothetical protein